MFQQLSKKLLFKYWSYVIHRKYEGSYGCKMKIQTTDQEPAIIIYQKECNNVKIFLQLFKELLFKYQLYVIYKDIKDHIGICYISIIKITIIMASTNFFFIIISQT